MSSTTNYERDNSTISSSKDEMPTKITTMSEYEKRMEVNRVRAKEIRKRKKKMEEDMRQQIVKLTLENNRLRIQKKMQEVEIECLRKERYQQQTAMSMFNQHGGMNPLMLGLPQANGLNGIPCHNPNEQVSFDLVRQQMLSSLSGKNGGSVQTGAPSESGVPVTQSNSPALTPSPNQVEAAFRYDQALFNQLSSMQGGLAGGRMSLQNQVAAMGGPDGGEALGNDQNQQIINLLSDRSLSVQEGILMKLAEHSNQEK